MIILAIVVWVLIVAWVFRAVWRSLDATDRDLRERL